MNLQFYSYANIIRILSVDEDVFSQSIIIDINIDSGEILSVFDASKQFDADFIRSFINILRVSTTGFELISEMTETEDSASTVIGVNSAIKDRIIASLSNNISINDNIKNIINSLRTI